MLNVDDFDDDYQEVEEALPSSPSEGEVPSRPLFSDEDQKELSEIHDLRKRLIDVLSTKEKPVPEGTGEKIMLMQLLDGREKAVFQKTRLKIASKIEEAGTNLAALAASVLLQTKIERPPLQRPRELRLDNGLKHSNPVPGMMDVGVVQVRYEDVVPKRED